MERSRITKAMVIAVLCGGAVAIAAAIWGLNVSKINFFSVTFFILTVLIGSRITIQVPRFKSFISASEIFTFLALLLYGGSFAIILASADALTTSWRVCNKKITVFYNAATMAVSTGVVVLILKFAGLDAERYLHGYSDSLHGFVSALSMIALTHFLVNTALAAAYNSVRDNQPIFEIWKNKYIWSFFSYFVGAAGAGLLVQLADAFGMGMILAAFPICFFVFYSYRMYMQNVEMSMRQAEQAEEYAKILEAQSVKLRDSEELFRSAFNYAPIGIGLVSPSGEWKRVNRAMTQILGYTESEFRSTDFQSMTLPEDLGVTLVKVHEILGGKIANYQMEQRYRHKNGNTVWASWSVSTASEFGSTKPDLIFQIQDITERKCIEEKLQHEASHDVLTGLPNRSVFMTALADALTKTHAMREYNVSILFIDLDRFKYVNDSLGHVIGDELLKGIAARLKECMRPSDMVARLGGDEFTILVEGHYDIAEVTRIAERIQHKFEMPFDLQGHEVYSTASIGILHATDRHITPEDIMRDADTAMYSAKRSGKARHEIFDEEMHNSARETLRLETDLRRAVERNELSHVYQPIYSLITGCVEGVEVLARWIHPELGPISPSRFVPLAEEIGLVDRLCEQTLRKACREIGAMHDRRSNKAQLTMSVNLSCRQFAQSTLVQSICGILDETGFSPEHLKLEITESVFFEHLERAVVMLNKLREIGVDIHIDDFGTGYSNLSYLTKLPISTLKVDRSFVSTVDGEGRNEEVIRGIVSLARNLGLNVIAEGVETEIQLGFLRDLGCDSAQGYYFAAPMEYEELCRFLAESDEIKRIPLLAGEPAVSELVQ